MVSIFVRKNPERYQTGENMENYGIFDEIIHDFGIKTPRVMIGGEFAVVDSVRKIYVLSEEIVTLQTSEGYVSILGEEISVKTLCDERMELTGRFSGVEFIRSGSLKDGGRGEKGRKISRRTEHKKQGTEQKEEL